MRDRREVGGGEQSKGKRQLRRNVQEKEGEAVRMTD